jgi:aminoglycoside 2''-phosphotransferase
LGLDLGAFLRSLHAVPVALGLEAGLEGGASPEDWRRRQAQQYERARREAFPLLTAAACHYAEALYEQFLSDDANFRFQSVILHADLYEDHVLVTEDGLHLSGVLDFGDASIGDPAWDFVWQLGGGGKNGAAVSLGRSGLEAHLDAYGPEARSYAARARFYELVWPFLVILGGIDLEQESYVQSGLKQFEERAQTAGS